MSFFGFGGLAPPVARAASRRDPQCTEPDLRMVDGCDTFIVFLRKIIAGTSSLLISLTVRHTFEKHPFYAGAMLSPWRDRDDEHGLTQKTKRTTI